MSTLLRSRELGRPPVTLLALWGAELPTATLRRAARISATLGHELHVHRVLPVIGGPALFTPYGFDSTFRAVSAAEHAVRVTRSWVGNTLGDDTAWSLTTTRGDFTSCVVTHASEVRATLIVVSPAGGRVAEDIACEAGTSVLVPREEAEGIVAERERTYDGALARCLEPSIGGGATVAAVRDAPARRSLVAMLECLVARVRATLFRGIAERLLRTPTMVDPVPPRDREPGGGSCRSASSECRRSAGTHMFAGGRRLFGAEPVS